MVILFGLVDIFDDQIPSYLIAQSFDILILWVCMIVFTILFPIFLFFFYLGHSYLVEEPFDADLFVPLYHVDSLISISIDDYFPGIGRTPIHLSQQVVGARIQLNLHRIIVVSIWAFFHEPFHFIVVTDLNQCDPWLRIPVVLPVGSEILLDQADDAFKSVLEVEVYSLELTV